MLGKTEELTEEVKEILRGDDSPMLELEQINIEVDRLEGVDSAIFHLQNVINGYSHQIIPQFPGLLDDVVRQFTSAYPLLSPCRTVPRSS